MAVAVFEPAVGDADFDGVGPGGNEARFGSLFDHNHQAPAAMPPTNTKINKPRIAPCHHRNLEGRFVAMLGWASMPGQLGAVFSFLNGDVASAIRVRGTSRWKPAESPEVFGWAAAGICDS